MTLSPKQLNAWRKRLNAAQRALDRRQRRLDTEQRRLDARMARYVAARGDKTQLDGSAITKMALEILHQKLDFISSTNGDYAGLSDSAEVGSSLRIRPPFSYTIKGGETQ